MVWDGKLERRFVDEAEFAEVVKANVGMVYHTAVRCLNGSDDEARDVTQVVFIDLHRKWSSLPAGTVVPGWLYRHTRFLAWRWIRSERRRVRREREAARRIEMHTNQQDLWGQLRPLIDRAVARLNPAERNVVVLRFFRGQTLREIGEALGIGEDAARMRVNRALERLRRQLERLGIHSTTRALSGALMTGASAAAPVGLAQATLGAVGGVAGGVTAGGFFKGITIMKTKSVIISTVMVLGVGGPLAMFWSAEKRNQELTQRVAQREHELAELNREVEDSQSAQEELRDQIAELRKDRAELFRLRGQVNQLRSDNEQLKGRIEGDAEVENRSTRLENDVIALRRYEGVVDAPIRPGETLVTGGWEIEPGRFGFVMLDAERLESEDGDQVIIRGEVVEGPEEMAEAMHLDRLRNADDVNTRGEVLDRASLNAYLAEQVESGDVSKLHGPAVTTLSGREATISIAKQVIPGEEEQQTGLTLSVLPEVLPGGEGVNLQLVSEWVVPESE